MISEQRKQAILNSRNFGALPFTMAWVNRTVGYTSSGGLLDVDTDEYRTSYAVGYTNAGSLSAGAIVSTANHFGTSVVGWAPASGYLTSVSYLGSNLWACGGADTSDPDASGAVFFRNNNDVTPTWLKSATYPGGCVWDIFPDPKVPGRVILVGYSTSRLPAVYSTTDSGVSWTTHGAPAFTDWVRGLAYSPTLDLYVVVGDSSGSTIAWSTDLSSWTLATLDTPTGLLDGVDWDGTAFVAAGLPVGNATTSGVLARSVDGKNFKVTASPGGGISDIRCIDGVSVVAGYDATGAATTQYTATTKNGTTYASSGVITGRRRGLGGRSGLVMASGYGLTGVSTARGTVLLGHYDVNANRPTTWNPVSLPAGVGCLRTIASRTDNKAIVVAGGLDSTGLWSAGAVVYSHDNGVTWTKAALPAVGYCVHVKYDAGAFYAVFLDVTAYNEDGDGTTTGTLMKSTDNGVTWSSIYTVPGAPGGLYVSGSRIVVGYRPNDTTGVLAVSNDLGVSWTQVTLVPYASYSTYLFRYMSRLDWNHQQQRLEVFGYATQGGNLQQYRCWHTDSDALVWPANTAGSLLMNGIMPRHDSVGPSWSSTEKRSRHLAGTSYGYFQSLTSQYLPASDSYGTALFAAVVPSCFGTTANHIAQSNGAQGISYSTQADRYIMGGAQYTDTAQGMSLHSRDGIAWYTRVTPQGPIAGICEGDGRFISVGYAPGTAQAKTSGHAAWISF